MVFNGTKTWACQSCFGKFKTFCKKNNFSDIILYLLIFNNQLYKLITELAFKMWKVIRNTPNNCMLNLFDISVLKCITTKRLSKTFHLNYLPSPFKLQQLSLKRIKMNLTHAQIQNHFLGAGFQYIILLCMGQRLINMNDFYFSRSEGGCCGLWSFECTGPVKSNLVSLLIAIGCLWLGSNWHQRASTDLGRSSPSLIKILDLMYMMHIHVFFQILFV